MNTRPRRLYGEHRKETGGHGIQPTTCPSGSVGDMNGLATAGLNAIRPPARCSDAWQRGDAFEPLRKDRALPFSYEDHEDRRDHGHVAPIELDRTVRAYSARDNRPADQQHRAEGNLRQQHAAQPAAPAFASARPASSRRTSLEACSAGPIQTPALTLSTKRKTTVLRDPASRRFHGSALELTSAATESPPERPRTEASAKSAGERDGRRS